MGRSRSGLLTRWTNRLKGGSAEWDGLPEWDGSVRMRDGSISSWVRGAISPSRGGDEDGDQFVGSWRDLAGGRGGLIGSWRDLIVAWRGQG